MSKRPLPSVIYLRALKEARPWYPHLGVILCLGFLQTPIALLAPLPVKIIIDNVIGDRPPPLVMTEWLPPWMIDSKDSLLYLSMSFAVLAALLTVAHYCGEWLFRESIGDQMVRRFRGNVLRNALGLSTIRDEDRGVVDQLFRINQDAPSLQAITIWGVLPFIIAFTSVASVLWVTALIHPQMAVIALATATPLIVLIYFSQRPLCDRWHRVREIESGISRLVFEVLSAQRVVITAGREDEECRRLVSQARASFFARLAIMGIESLFRLALACGTGVGTAAILYIGVRDVQSGVLTPGDLWLLLAYLPQLYDALKTIAVYIIGQQAAIACGERAFELLERPTSVPQTPKPRPLERAKGRISFHGVCFTYPRGREVLRDVSFDVPAGTCVGIVGPTGAGKSTLVNMLVRMMDPLSGCILLDGVDLRQYRLADLRRQFAVMEQEPALFSTSIAENIAYGRPDASRADIEAAAMRAHAHGFISELPNGYDSMVGERSLNLSGGERQRICLARAFLKQAPILILDEPTSALDAATEAAITAGVEELMKGRTTFIIAHRLSTLRRADMVLRVEDAQVALEPPLHLANAAE